MMKHLSYILCVSLLLVSCRKQEEVRYDDMPAGICFGIDEVLQTRTVLINDKFQLLSGDAEFGYGVYAARFMPSDANNTHELFMSNVKVSSTDGKEWNYDMYPDQEGTQLCYWSPGAVHNFFAVYPYYDSGSDEYDLGLESEINEGVHALQVTGTDASAILTGTTVEGTSYTNICPDILYGIARYPIPYSIRESRDSVVFNFNHALAAVSFRLRNISEYTVTQVSQSELTGFKNSAEYVRLSDRGAEWGASSSDASKRFSLPRIDADLEPGAYYEPGGSLFWYTALMIPQNFGADTHVNPQMSFTATLSTGDPKEYTLNFKDYPVSAVAEYQYQYQAGYHYIYNLSITAAQITCDVEIVDWIDDDPIELN